MTTNPQAHHRYLSDDDEYEKYAPIGVDGLLAATEKLLAVNRGLADPDDRDALPNDRIYTVDRLMAERVKLDHGKTLRSLMGRLSRAKSLAPLGADAFSDYTVGYLKSNPLVPALEEINPMHILEQKRRITKMGPGGIGDPNAVTPSMNAIHASQFGFIDPLAGPECFPGDHEVYTRRGWVRWDEVLDGDVFACCVSGRLVWNNASRVVRIAYIGHLYEIVDRACIMRVTPDHRVIHLEGGQLESTPAREMFGRSLLLPSGIVVDDDTPLPPSSARSIELPAALWVVADFDGLVYCATVPGGMLLVRGSSDTLCYWTGNSERAGIDVRLAHGTRVGSDGKIYQLLLDRRIGKKRWVSTTEVVGKTIKLPD
jgi:hypothetical protein